jgi:shikimate kinase
LTAVGAPGSGKTAVGHAVAQRWECEFLDSDEQYRALTGTTVGEAVIDDEASFRDTEQRIVLEALSTPGAVVAVGSGAVQGGVAEVLKSIPAVWLEVGLPDTARRTGLSGARPLSLGNVRGQLHEMLKARGEVYAQVADLVVKTDGRIVDSVAEEIIGWEAERDDN